MKEQLSVSLGLTPGDIHFGFGSHWEKQREVIGLFRFEQFTGHINLHLRSGLRQQEN